MSKMFFVFKESTKNDLKKENSLSNHKEDNLEKSKDDYKFPYEQSANELMSDKGFVEYVKKNGYHFNKKLAEYISKLSHEKTTLLCITESQILEAIENSKITINKKSTMGDILYASNFAHSTLYPDLLKDVKSCVIYANKMANVGYEGAIFCRWTSDVIGKNMKIDWGKFI